MHKNLPTVEGVKTRFLCSITADEGTNTTLAGYVKVGGESLPMTAGGENELVAPATPAGDYLYELRAGGAVVLWGHLCARPSAFPPVEDATAIEVAATITGETAIAVSITLKEGPQGSRGESGHLQPVDPSTGELTLTPGHILDLGTLATDTDLTALSFAESANVQTAELWFTTATTAPVITWPADAVWAGDAPALVPATAYRFALRREPNGKLIINLAYEYSL